MSVLRKIASLGRQPTGAETRPAVATVPGTASDIEARLAQIPAELEAARKQRDAADARRDALCAQRNEADALVQQLTDEAAAGMLADATRLTEALRRRRELHQAGEDDSCARRVDDLLNEEGALRNKLSEIGRQEASKAYFEAVQQLAVALGPVRYWARIAQKNASAANVILGDGNTNQIIWIGPEVLIGGAVLDVPNFRPQGV
jgi:chromosome segregation ATPase